MYTVVVIPKWRLIPSIIPVAFIVLGKKLDINVERIGANVDRLTDEYTDGRWDGKPDPYIAPC